MISPECVARGKVNLLSSLENRARDSLGQAACGAGGGEVVNGRKARMNISAGAILWIIPLFRHNYATIAPIGC
jgi:hypothetical protein